MIANRMRARSFSRMNTENGEGRDRPAAAATLNPALSSPDVPPEKIKVWPGHVFIYIALLVAHVALVWWLPHFPTQDGPNHVYTLVTLQDLLHGKTGWESTYYALNLHLAPNLGFELFTYPWLSVVTPLVAERVFLTIYILLVGASVPLFLRVLGKPALPLSYFAFVAIFSQPVMMGFYSEIAGTPLLLLAVALAWKLRESRPWLRVVALNLAGLVIYVVHLIPFVIYLLAVGIMAAAEEDNWRAAARRATERGLTLIPCLTPAVIFYILHHPAGNLGWAILPGPILRDMFSFGDATYSPWQLLPGVAAFVLVYLATRTAFRARGTHPSDKELVLRRFLVGLCLLLFAFFLWAPNWIAGGAEMQRRFPPLILLFGLPLLEPWTPRLTRGRYAQLAAAVAAFTLAVNAGIFWQQSLRVEKFLRGMQANLPQGAQLITIRLDGEQHQFPDPLFHAACYYGLAGTVDLGQYLNTQQSNPYFQVRFLEPIRSEEAIDWYNGTDSRVASELPQAQYVLCWGGGCQKNLQPDFTRFWSEEGNPLSIWKR
jgi:hypothetical protein